MTQRQFVTLPTGSSRNKIEALADYLDALMIANPTIILPGQSAPVTVDKQLQLPPNSDGGPDFSVVNTPYGSTTEQYPLTGQASFNSRLDKMSDSAIEFTTQIGYEIKNGGFNGLTPPYPVQTTTIDALKSSIQSQASSDTYAGDLDNYSASGVITLKFPDATTAPTIIDAQMSVMPVMS
ncbi:hypothetical protein [Celerinatantimonas sp. YJH-8]|uniref:hypothetical protein n=1 Tax=Celerinatantimonas sp. YJH-8 TaxID=3228714 RepID=UPI0038CAA730